MAEVRLCGARNRKGGVCQHEAGWGTDHPGYGQCRLHYGNTLNGRISAARQMAEDAAVKLGFPIPTEPAEGLQLCVDLARAHVEFWTLRIAELGSGDAVGPLTTKVKRDAGGKGDGSYEQETKGPPTAHIYIRLQAEAMERLARFSEMATKANVAERRQQLAEADAGELVRLFTKVCDALGLEAEQRQVAAATVYGHLQLVEGTAVEEAAA